MLQELGCRIFANGKLTQPLFLFLFLLFFPSLPSSSLHLLFSYHYSTEPPKSTTMPAQKIILDTDPVSWLSVPGPTTRHY